MPKLMDFVEVISSNLYIGVATSQSLPNAVRTRHIKAKLRLSLGSWQVWGFQLRLMEMSSVQAGFSSFHQNHCFYGFESYKIWTKKYEKGV